MRFKFTFLRKIAANSAIGMKVILGSYTAKAFVVAPKDFDVIGIVRIGMEFGLLAKSQSGNYFRVNGSQSTWLDKHAVEDAIYRAKQFGRGESFSATRLNELTSMSLQSPIVLLRKHRRVNPAIAANSHSEPLAA